MKILIFLLSCLVTTSCLAQQGWVVKFGNRVVLQASKEDLEKNAITLAKAKKGALTVSYQETIDKNFDRSLAVYDAGDNELYKKTSRTITIPQKTVQGWAKKGSPVKVYTMLVPLNPNIAVRLRRVHLCTINFK